MKHGTLCEPQGTLTACTIGDETAFTEIVRVYSPRLIIIAASITRNRLTAEDIVQEAFLRLWQKRSVIIPDNLGGWLYRVVTNLSYKHQSDKLKQLHAIHSISKTKEGSCKNVEEYLISKENDRIFRNIVNRLPEKQRKVYHLSRINGLSRNEIAYHLNLSPNTVKVHLSRALQFVKEYVVSLSLFCLFFLVNNIFFQRSNTMPSPKDLYETKQAVQKKTPDKELTCYNQVDKKL
jgi:RNA polymerase sigma-19 factor, ECF subfamily